MTEDEAKKKWCPMTRNIQVVARSASGHQDYADFKSHCIASECMMWVRKEFTNDGDCGLKR